MSLEQTLRTRSDNKCELCTSENNLSAYEVSPSDGTAEQSLLVCDTCLNQINSDQLDEKHWHCLRDSMWNPNTVVQVQSWRLLKQLGWSDLVDMIYFDDETLSWAEAGLTSSDDDNAPTLDANGVQLLAGDTVTIIKDLVVKGAGFTAKRGTAVRNISLTSNPEHIEGRVNGTRIVLLSCYLKKSN